MSIWVSLFSLHYWYYVVFFFYPVIYWEIYIIILENNFTSTNVFKRHLSTTINNKYIKHMYYWSLSMSDLEYLQTLNIAIDRSGFVWSRVQRVKMALREYLVKQDLRPCYPTTWNSTCMILSADDPWSMLIFDEKKTTTKTDIYKLFI